MGALVRPVGGWLSDKLGGARVTFWNFIAMALGVYAVLQFLPSSTTAGGTGGNFTGFLISFMALFAFAGIGNGSTFRMIPVIFLTERQRAATKTATAQAQAVKDANKEAAASLVDFLTNEDSQKLESAAGPLPSRTAVWDYVLE